MTIKYCPHCMDLGDTKVLDRGYKQVRIQDGVAKRRKVRHRTEDGGCGNEWFTFEISEHNLMRIASHIFTNS